MGDRISTHASLAGRDGRRRRARREEYISTHASLAGRDKGTPAQVARMLISTHASLAGRDFSWPCLLLPSCHFNPRVPCGTRPSIADHMFRASLFQPTRPLRDATISHAPHTRRMKISTHASLAGRDAPPRVACANLSRISTHASLAGRDVRSLNRRLEVPTFQPTRPLRDATRAHEHRGSAGSISTHASLAGRDNRKCRGETETHKFQPTRPLRDATQY